MEHSEEENKTQREHIASIFKEYTTPSRVLRSFTNLANTVIQTALSGQSKFVFEILQNADDSYEDQDKSIELKFILQDNYLIVNHNGKGFDFNDVERICDYASQIEEVKATDLRKTGYKGLGFKSLFNLSDCIYIHSNGYTFRFDKGYWPDPESKPWQVIPIWCEYHELPLNQKKPYDEPVNLILKVNDVTQLESQLKELADQPDLLLYLFRINKLSVTCNEEEHFLERKTEEFGGFKKIDFYKNQKVESTWLSRDYTQPIPKDLQTVIRGASRFIYPDRIRNADEITFTFALQSDKTLNKISKITGICYSTLPTQLDLELPYHINSLFILNLDRTQLHENEWNEFLVEQLGYLQFQLLKELAEMEYLKNYVIQLLVREINHPYDKFNKAFLKGFKLGKGKIGWLPSYKGNRLLKLGNVWTDETEFFKQDFQYIQNNEIIRFLINYEVKDQYLLSFESESNHFTYDLLFEDFPTKYYRQLTRNAYVNFITYLCKSIKDYTNMTKLESVPFLVAKDGTLVSPSDALLEEIGHPIPTVFMLNTISNEYLPLSNIYLIKDWLTDLGARRLSTPIEILRESVLKWIDSGNLHKKINIKNHIEILSYIAKGVKDLTHNETEKLKQNLYILTESKQFKLASLCYFPDAVWEKELSITSNDETISSSYNLKYLRDLFILLGVIDIVNPIDVLRKGVLIWIKNGNITRKIKIGNYLTIIDFLAKTYFKLKYELSETEEMELKKVPVLTCHQTFQKAEDCYFESAVPKVKGLEGLVPNNRLVTTNHSKCVTDFLAEIGVSRSMMSIDVMRKSILKWIQEGYITNRITIDNHHDILKYIAEHWISLNIGLQTKEKEEMKKMPILTKSGVFKAAYSCYWPVSDLSEEQIKFGLIPGLKSFISDDELVSPEYFKAPKYLKELKYLTDLKNLLNYLGVHKPGFTDIYEKYSDHLNKVDYIQWFFCQLEIYWSNIDKVNKLKDNKLMNFLRQKFHASPCLLAENDKKYTSTKIYSSIFANICDIDLDTLLILKHYTLPKDLEKFLGFQTSLDIKCIKQLLEAVGKKTELDEDKTLLFFITMLNQLKKIDKTEVRKSQLSLLSEDNKLKHATDLYYFIEEDATCYLESYYLKRIVGMSHDQTLELAELCGVNKIPFQQDIIREKETRDKSLNEFYLERLPFIALQESKKLYRDFKVILKRLYDEICSTALYLCHSIQVKYPFGDNTDVQHHFEGLELYIVGEWCKKKSKIHDYLKEKLGLKTDIRDILDMRQPITQSDKKSWLSFSKQDQQELDSVEELLKKFLLNDRNKQSDLFTADEFLQNNQDHDSECEYRNFKDNGENLSDVISLSNKTTPSVETLTDNEMVQNDQAHHFEHENINFKERSQELLDAISPPNESLTDHVFNQDDIYLKKKKAFEHKNKQVCLTVIDKLRVSEPHDGSTDSGTELLNLNRQSEMTVEISHIDQVHHSEYEDRNLKEIPNGRSTSNERLTDYVYEDEEDSNLQNKNVFELESKQTCGTIIDNQKFQSKNRKNYEPHEFSADSVVGGYITKSDTKLLISSKTETVTYVNKPYLQNKHLVKHESSKFCGTLTDKLNASVPHEGTFADEMNTSSHLEDVTESVIGEDNIEFDTILLIPCKLKTSHINRIPHPEIPTKGLHTGSSRCLPEVSGDKSDIIWLSEKYVFTCLQKHYTKKYPNAEYNLSEGIFTLQWQSKKIEIVWLNASGEKGKSYDILLKKEGVVKRFIEVKSTEI